MAFPETQEVHRSGSNSQVGSRLGNVRYGSKADIVRCGERRRYSITSSAVCRFLHDHIECLDKGKSEREKVDE